MSAPFITIIDSRIVHAMGPILASARGNQMRFYDGAFFVDPHPDGVLCSATDGHVIAFALDRGAKTSQAAQLCMPADLVDACSPHAGHALFYEGDVVEHPAPAWLQPASVCLFNSGAFVIPTMHHPGDDPEGGHCLFRCGATTGGIYSATDFRTQLPRIQAASHVLSKYRTGRDPIRLDPAKLGMLSGLDRTFNVSPRGLRGATRLIPGYDLGPIGVQFEHAPDVFALVMPMRDEGRVAPPPFLGGLMTSEAFHDR